MFLSQMLESKNTGKLSFFFVEINVGILKLDLNIYDCMSTSKMRGILTKFFSFTQQGVKLLRLQVK